MSLLPAAFVHQDCWSKVSQARWLQQEILLSVQKAGKVSEESSPFEGCEGGIRSRTLSLACRGHLPPRPLRIVVPCVPLSVFVSEFPLLNKTPDMLD